MSKGLSKYIAALDYYNKVLIVLSALSGEISILSFASVIGAPIGIGSAGFRLAFWITTRITMKLLKTIQNKKKIA